MSAASFRRQAPGVTAASDPRPPVHTPHLALVSAAQASFGHEPSSRTPQQAFGARLKAARERRGIALKTVASSTKVTTSLFEALERGNISRWPKGLYKRAFFRGYVAAIGLPTESTVDEFLRLFPDEEPAGMAADAPVVQRASTNDTAALRLTLAPGDSRRSRLPRLSTRAAIDMLVTLVLSFGVAWWAGLDAWTTAAVMGIACYPQVARQLRALYAKSRRPGVPRAAAAENVGENVSAPAEATTAAVSS